MTDPREAGWTPILDGEQAQRAWEAVDAIAADLRRIAGQPPPADDESAVRSGRWTSLAGGQAGLALFFAYLDRVRPDQGHGDAALAALEQAIEAMGEDANVLPSLYSGFPGVAWAVEHLQEQLIDTSEHDPGEDIATALEEYLGVPSGPGRNYDLIGGLAGLGVYALERLPRPGGRECLRLVLDRLSELSQDQGDGVAWLTPPERITEESRDRYPGGNFNLGVAHGVPGVIAVLGEAQAAGCEAGPLLSGAVRWLLAQRLPPDVISAFPYVAAPGPAPQGEPARLAWCYGDLGIAAALLSAARRAGDPSWEAEALAIARKAVARPASKAGVIDVGLCHGAAGLGHLFNRIYQATGEEVFREATLFWFDWGLERRKPESEQVGEENGEGAAGFIAWDADDRGEMKWMATTGFLTGAAGIGLALLAALTPVEPSWDRLLLSSIPLHRR